ncbi:hypothetical protein OW493_02935 [Cobetia sp. 14N.309.X.WAT.E.A4]|uniref:hypothetical protein n=1 Tax=Cobetia sp. 14N.309.X.WAT.E.A4 TaxID=2998323 RepID=UPI0025B0BD77|nr:hypothetical protein [Cobetia sp. 14N.309.X.WAT.E.A4]MDN2655401.1 hypothetical protein [Cobetia sp. 14N.309.X.WAT.E.A4]
MIKLSESELSNNHQKLIALTSGILAFLLGCFYYDTLTTAELLFNPVFFLKLDNKLVFNIPGLIHGLIALGMLVPLYLRKIIAYRNMSIASILFFVINLYLFSAWIQLAVGVEGDFSNTIINIGLMSALLLGWLGIRAIAGYCWIIIVLLCGYNMLNSSEMLAAWGLLFLVLSVISVWFQTKMALDDFFLTMKSEFSNLHESNIAMSAKDSMQAGASEIIKQAETNWKKKR